MITKAQIREFVRGKLGSDPRWALKGLTEVYKFQTADEQEHEHTEELNGVGFTGTDGEFLTSLAKQYLRYGRLSEKQMTYLMKKMPKYWKQILRISDEQKLLTLMNK